MRTTALILPSQIWPCFPLHLLFHTGLYFSSKQPWEHARAIQRSHANAYLSPITPNTAGLHCCPLKPICFVLNIFTLENISRESKGEPCPCPQKAAVCRILIGSSVCLMLVFDVSQESVQRPEKKMERTIQTGLGYEQAFMGSFILAHLVSNQVQRLTRDKSGL